MRVTRKLPVSLWGLAMLAVAAITAIGCGPDLPAQSDVQFDRPLGAWARVVDDPQRATPRPGERVRYRVAVVHVDPAETDDDLRSMFLVCTAPEQFTGVPVCREFLDGTFAPGDAMAMAGAGPGAGAGAGAGGAPLELACGDDPFDMAFGPFALACVHGTPEVEFEVEPDFTAKKKFIVGVVCQRGEPFITDGSESTLISCRERPGETLGEVMPVFGTVVVSQDADGDNDNPDLRELVISLDDAPWLSLDDSRVLQAPLPETGCADLTPDPSSLPQLSLDGDPPTFVFGFPVEALETTPEGIEPLILAAHTTSGDIGRFYSAFGEDPRAVMVLAQGDGLETSEFEYTPDAEADVADGGKLVRFFFTARDERGGFDLTERALCLVP